MWFKINYRTRIHGRSLISLGDGNLKEYEISECPKCGSWRPFGETTHNFCHECSTPMEGKTLIEKRPYHGGPSEPQGSVEEEQDGYLDGICPVCGEQMIAEKHSITGDFYWDRCPKCKGEE